MIINDDQRNWADKCPMGEFALNSSVSTTTGFAPFKLNQGYMPQIGIPTSFDTTFKGVKQFALQEKGNLMAAHDAIITNRIQRTFHANKICRCEVCLRYFTKSLRAMVFMQTVYSTVVRGYS